MFVAPTEELAAFGAAVRRFAETEIEPVLDGLCAGTVPAVPLLRSLAAAVGLGDGTDGSLALSLSPDTTPPDALGASFMLMKELARVSPGMALVLGGSVGLVGGAIAGTGTATQRDRWLGPLLRLESVGAWCLTEPEAGSDAFGSMRTRAVVDGDSFVVKGSKTYISNAPLADVFLVYARVTGHSGDDGEVRAFVLDRTLPGLSTGPALAKMGAEESPIAEVFVDDVPAGPDRLLGGSGAGGREAVKRSMTEERGALPAIALGICERAYELALRYAREREQFGRPIGQFQAVQLRLARMAVAVENCRHWVDRLLGGPRTPALVCLAKAYTAEAAVEVAAGAMHVLGGLGYLRDGRVEKLARDARILEVGAGTTDINLLAAARSELGFG